MAKDYIDRVLIKLRREYSKDELVTYLFNKTKTLELENGQLKAEIDHLTHCLDKKKHVQQVSKEISKEAKIELRKNQLFNLRTEELGRAKREIKLQKEKTNQWISKYVELQKMNEE